MSSKELRNGGEYKTEKPAWKIEREAYLAKVRAIGQGVMSAVAAVIVGAVLVHSANTKEIMDDGKRVGDVKTIDGVEGIIFRDGVNGRKEPFVDNANPNALASVGEEGQYVRVDYDGKGYYYNSGDDGNGGWYGIDAKQVSKRLAESGCISEKEANHIAGDKDGVIWLNEGYVEIINADGKAFKGVDESTYIN